MREDGAAGLRMDMHLHTRHSFDCLSEPLRVLEAADRRGIDRLIVTDHNEIAGALELQALAPTRVLVGEEVKTREGFDVIGILLEDRIPGGTPARETCERIRAQGGIVYIPHPFDGARAGGASFLESLSDLIDVVEVHNARCLRASYNRRAWGWARENQKLVGAGSDAHTLAEIGAGFIVLPPFEMNRASLLKALSSAVIAGRKRSSPLYRISSTYAKLHKRLPFTSRKSR
ncbi:PHP domain-containing protein [soil metagenome]